MLLRVSHIPLEASSAKTTWQDNELDLLEQSAPTLQEKIEIYNHGLLVRDKVHFLLTECN